MYPLYRPLPDYVTIRESPIAGLGLFATKRIPAGTYLGIIHIINKNEGSYQNFEDARLNRAKLSSLSRAIIVELSPKKKKKKNIAVNALRVIQQAKLQEHFYEYRNITKEKPAKKKAGHKTKYSVLLGPENKERIEKLANILTNLEYSNFQIVVKNSKMEIKEDEDNNSNYLTIDPKDFNLPDVEEEKMPSLQK